jgi:hypothetical protein
VQAGAEDFYIDKTCEDSTWVVQLSIIGDAEMPVTMDFGRVSV